MIKTKCIVCGVELLDELEVTNETLQRFETEDQFGIPTCLCCLLIDAKATFWQHEGSEVVFTASPTGSWSQEDMDTLSPDVDEIFLETFFQRIKDGWAYKIDYPKEINV